MKWFLSAVLFFASLMIGCGEPGEGPDEANDFDGRIGMTEQAVSQTDKNWWKNLTADQRAGEIITRCIQDLNKFVGLNCKDWARKVVSDASHGVVSLPSTAPDATGWSWYGSPYVQNVGSMANATTGDVVQMNLGPGKPHTAIVWSSNANMVCWLDSNWKLDLTARFHCQTMQEFLNSVTSGGVKMYSVYRINGG